MATQAQATVQELEEVFHQAQGELSDLEIERLQIPAKLVAAAAGRPNPWPGAA